MEKVLLLILTVGFVNGSLHKLGHILKKRRSDPDMIDFTPECSSVLMNINTQCLENVYKLYASFTDIEREAVTQWELQCLDNVYDCISSPDQQLQEVISYYKILLPQIKSFCADGCMVPIINLIHTCLKQEMLDEIGISKAEMEDIFDLVCIQEGPQANGQEGEYCIIKAMTTATYLLEANKIHYCNLDGIDLTKCDGTVDNVECTCNTNCSTLMTTANALMGCCMGTLLEIETTFNLSHPDADDLLNPGNKLFDLCAVSTKDACDSSKEVIAMQEEQYNKCFGALKTNSKSECIALEDDVHDKYLFEMQRIDMTCKEHKNINVCKDPTSKVQVSQDLKEVLTKLNDHCSQCGAELAGIRENCTVFLPNEAKMLFQMMCLRNTDMEHCGPKIIEYEAERERQDLNSNPCFKGYMSTTQHQCSANCSEEVIMMNKYNVLNCFDALIDYIHSPSPEWHLWHKNCIKDPLVQVNNKIVIYVGESQKDFDNSNNKNKYNSASATIRIVAFTFVGTVGLALLIAGLLLTIYKRQMVMNMFGYNKFRDGGGDSLITDVHMEDTMGEDYEDDRGENYYD